MSRVVQVCSTKILIPDDPENQDKFIGLWLQAQRKAITKVYNEFVCSDYTSDEIEEKIDEYTLKFYKQIKLGGHDVYRRKFEA